MQKERKKALGYSLIILGLIVIFLKPITSITGFTVASESLSVINEIWLLVAGWGMIIAGALLSYQAQAKAYREQNERESELKKLLGEEQYERLSDKDKIAINKSYRRYLEKSRIEKKIEKILPEAKNLAQEILERGAIIQNPGRLVQIARQMGYPTKAGREGTRVLTLDGENLTDIPGHDISIGVYRSIMKSLATGEPSHRRRTR